jgi:hypothetical protein
MNISNGYYTVDGKLFVEKIEAILYANEKLSDISWTFHDNVFSKVNWQIEPETDLKELYKIRAEQIRSQYDYIVALASGGADSTNAILSFLENGIHIDEIVASVPLEGMNGLQDSDTNNEMENTFSEFRLTQLPFMNELASRFPKVKLTLNDYFKIILEYKTDDWILYNSDWIHPANARFNLENLKHIRDMADAGKKIAVLYGIDKPNLVLGKDGTLSTRISDITTNTARPPFNRSYPNVENVFFYYSPELPQLMIKQAHLVAKWFTLPENSHVKKYLRTTDVIPFERNRVRQSFWERSIIPCIYPDTAKPVFQAHKPIRHFFPEHDHWYYSTHYNTRSWQMFDSDFRNFIKNIDQKYLNTLKVGFTEFRKEFVIGNIKDFSSNNITSLL